MQVTKKTGSLDIEGSRHGRVHFRSGSVTGAELTGNGAKQEGSEVSSIADILYVLSTLEEGSFSVGSADGPETDGLGVEEILTEVDALKSLEGEVDEAGLLEPAGVRLVDGLETKIVIEPEDWDVLASLVTPFTFEALESTEGRGSAVRILHTLHRLGVAESVPTETEAETETDTGTDSDEETEFLDKLAGGLSDSNEPMWLEQVSEEETGPKHVAPAENTEEPIAASDDDHVDDGESEESDEAPRERELVGEGVKGVSAPASTTLTDGVYDEIRRLRSKVADK